MTAPAEIVSQTVKAIQADAQPLGLIWNLLPATVTGATNPQTTTVTMDGDPQTPIPAISLIGFLTAGRRVFVIETPGGGLYIVGFGGPELHGVMRGETGVVSISFVAATGTTVAVTFARPFAVAPRVFTNINTGPASTNNYSSRAISITTTGFTMYVFNPAGLATTWAGVPVGWTALVDP